MGQVHAFHEPDLYDAIAMQIERENSVINHRLTWTLQLNGFLFTAVSLLGGKVLDDAALRALVAIFVPMTGLVVSVSAFMGVLAAQETCITSSTRNFKGRMGDPSSKVYMASPATVAASAIKGVITDAGEFLH